MHSTKLSTSDMSVSVSRSRPVETSTAFSSASPSSLARSNSSSSSSAPSPIPSLPPPQSPQLFTRIAPSSSNISGPTTKSIAIGSPGQTRRISLVSIPNVGSYESSSPVPPSPSAANRIMVPNVRDLRTSSYQTRVCGQDSTLVKVVRASMQGLTKVDAQGRVEVVPQSAAPAATATPTTPRLDRVPSTTTTSPTIVRPSTNSGVTGGRKVYIGLSVGPGHGKTYWEGKIAWPMEADTNAPAGSGAAPATNPSAFGTVTPGSSTPSTPRTGVPSYGQASSEVLASRNAAFQQLLHNLVTYLPPISASLIGPAKDYSSHAGAQHAGGQAHSVPTAIPLTPHSASSNTPSEPTTPCSAKEKDHSASDLAAIPPRHATSDSMAAPPRTVRRPSLTGLTLDDGWCDGEVVLSVFLLLDTIDVDSKQVTFIANASSSPAVHPPRHLEVNTLFQALYKVDFSVPAALNTQVQQVPSFSRSSSNSRPSSAAATKQ